MDETDNAEISSKLAFTAFRRFLWHRSATHPCVDLDTLWADMELADERNVSNDPAVWGEWMELWGSAEKLTLNQAFSAAMEFLRFERGWSKDDCVKDVLKQFNAGKAYQESVYWREWLEAVAATDE